MSWRDTVLARRLGLRVPIIQAPMAGGISTPAQADEPESGHRTGRHLIDGLPLPDRATTTMRLSPVFARTSDLEQDHVVVRPGDTLWELARGDLPRGADDRAVVEHVREIHETNRAVIGADPNLIRPGQQLLMP